MGEAGQGGEKEEHSGEKGRHALTLPSGEGWDLDQSILHFPRRVAIVL